MPLFVEELTKSMLESGPFGMPPTVIVGGSTPALAMPETLQDALTARLDRLAPIKDILQMGACIGREFSFELLAEVSDLSADELAARRSIN